MIALPPSLIAVLLRVALVSVIALAGVPVAGYFLDEISARIVLAYAQFGLAIVECLVMFFFTLAFFGVIRFHCPDCTKSMRLTWLRRLTFQLECPNHAVRHLHVRIFPRLWTLRKETQCRTSPVVDRWISRPSSPPVLDLTQRTLGGCSFGLPLRQSSRLGKPDHNMAHEGLTQLLYPHVGTIVNFHNELLHSAAYHVSGSPVDPGFRNVHFCTPVIRIMPHQYLKITARLGPHHLVEVLGPPHALQKDSEGVVVGYTYKINGLILEFFFSAENRLFLFRVNDTSSVISGI